jgi:NAD(P)-dependent dehydrogenase (short-subunit alcohol dehydrogenase family)
MQRLAGKVALVTAGAGRIGAATARRLASEGAQVMIADLLGDKAQALAEEIGPAAAATAFDAADETQVARVVAETVARFGTLTILHNNVAYLGADLQTGDTDVVNTSFEMWDKAMAINIRSYFAACKFAVPHMIAAGGGSIINTSSCAGLAADVMMIAYGTTKAAIIGFTRFVATQHGAQNIRCNAIAPGLVTDADMEAAMPEFTAMSRRHVAATRLGRGEDIAALVAFLASDESFYLTGECIRVDGGFLARMPHTADVADAVAAQGRLA